MDLSIERQLTTEAWEDHPRGSPQDLWLHSWREENLLAGGRGTHKSSHLVYKNAFQALTFNAGKYESILTEQVDKKVDEVLIPRQRKFINPDLFRIAGGTGSRDILWLAPNGLGYGPEHDGHITRLRGRQARLRHEDPPFRGLDAAYVGHDEIARDKDPVSEDRDPILVSMACQRGVAGRVKAQDYTTTPQANWFYDHALALGIADNDHWKQCSTDGRAAAYYAETEHTDPELYEKLRGRLSKELADQELRARWIPLSGRVWPSYIGDQRWPMGNRHWATFESDRPWMLIADLGKVESAWLVVQYHDPIDEDGRAPTDPEGRPLIFTDRIAVAVAQWIPDQLGSFMVLPMIREWISEHRPKYSRPWCVVTGQDIRSGGNRGDSAFVDFVAAQWDDDLRKPEDIFVEKNVQHKASARMICDDFGRRRFCVSDHIYTSHPNNRGGRGIHQVLSNFQMPEKGSASYWRKGPSQDPQGFCHMADVLGYWAVCCHGHEVLL